MWGNFFTVAQQVLILFILIGLGYLGGKLKLLTENGAKVCSNIVMYFACPALIVHSFLREFNTEVLTNMIIIMAVSIGSHVVGAAVSRLCFHNNLEPKERNVLRFATVFNNCAFMGLPMQNAILGDIGVFYGSTYGSMVTLIQWSYGVATMTGGSGRFSVKKMLLNPGVIAWVVGVVLFVCSVQLPQIITQPLNYLANLNTPLPMLIIGYHLSNTDMRRVLRNKRALLAVLLRLVVVPLICMGILLLTPQRGVAFVASMISIATPVAAVTTIFATKYGQDTELSAGLVSLSTLCSVITMPLLVVLSQTLA